MKIKINLIILITIFTLISCNNNIISTYYDNGVLRKTETYKGRKIEKNLISEKQFYKNGDLYSEQIYNIKKGISQEKIYDTSSVLICIINYKGNELDGEYIQYYKNGNIFAVGNYSNGRPIGEWVEFYRNKDTLSKTTFTDGAWDFHKPSESVAIDYLEKTDTLKVKNICDIELTYPNYPNFFIIYLTDNGSVSKSYNRDYGVKLNPSKAGKYNLRVAVLSKYNETGPVYEEIDYLSFDVKD